MNASLLARWSLLVVALVSGAQVNAQSTWWVDVSGTPPGSGSASDPYTEIGFALASAATVDGDEIRVRPGVYFESGIDFLGKAVRVTSTGGAASTIVDAGRQASCVLFRSGEGPGSRLEGLTLREGIGTQTPMGSASIRAGGGIFIDGASPSIADCRIELSFQSIDYGGGVFLRGSSATFRDCEFSLNGAYRGGGAALLTSTPLFERCTFEDNGPYSNTPFEGGGLYSDSSSPMIRDCVFLTNTSATGGAIAGPASIEDSYFEGNIGQFGGAVFGTFGVPAATTLDRCVFVNNAGLGYTGEDGFGGGAYGCVVRDSQFLRNQASSGGGVNSCEVARCLFLENKALEYENDQYAATGGGAAESTVEQSIFVRNETELITYNGGVPGAGGGAWRSTAVRCVFFDNLAGIGGAAFESDLDRCTVWGNDADTEVGGVYNGTVDSSIVRGNGEDLGAGASATYSNIEGGAPGTGNIDADPLFVDPEGGDFHLLPGSPVVDLGNPNAPRDFDQTRADMGAYPAADCNDNVVPDAQDIASQTSADANANGFPDECECKVESVCATSPNSAGDGAFMGITGSVGVARNDLTLVATGCPPNTSGLFYCGARGLSAPLGDGVRCIGGQVFRFPMSSTGPQGVASLAVDNTLSVPPAGQFLAGRVWLFQFYYSDPGGPGGSGVNLSDAMRVRFCD